MMRSKKFDPVAVALKEDIGEGDITSEAFVPAGAQISAQIIAREPAIIAGTKTAAEVFQRVDRKIKVRIVRRDGSAVMHGNAIIELRGPACSILTAERVALNFLQHLSGIATVTRKFVEAAGEKRVRILDTRKTIPGLRLLEKAAVVGGGRRRESSLRLVRHGVGER
jgi:nicotinate-nucleotide pyrophosphorylase (carboxylating)